MGKAYVTFCATAPGYLPCVMLYILNNVLVPGIKHLLIKSIIDVKIWGGGG
jgi:hypothetical protein